MEKNGLRQPRRVNLTYIDLYPGKNHKPDRDERHRDQQSCYHHDEHVPVNRIYFRGVKLKFHNQLFPTKIPRRGAKSSAFKPVAAML